MTSWKMLESFSEGSEGWTSSEGSRLPSEAGELQDQRLEKLLVGNQMERSQSSLAR